MSHYSEIDIKNRRYDPFADMTRLLNEVSEKLKTFDEIMRRFKKLNSQAPENSNDG